MTRRVQPKPSGLIRNLAAYLRRLAAPRSVAPVRRAISARLESSRLAGSAEPPHICGGLSNQPSSATRDRSRSGSGRGAGRTPTRRDTSAARSAVLNALGRSEHNAAPSPHTVLAGRTSHSVQRASNEAGRQSLAARPGFTRLGSRIWSARSEQAAGSRLALLISLIKSASCAAAAPRAQAGFWVRFRARFTASAHRLARGPRSLPRTGRVRAKKWSGRRDLNPRHPPWQRAGRRSRKSLISRILAHRAGVASCRA